MNKDIFISGHYEPTLSATVLRRCPVCNEKHPLAFDPPKPADKCPKCGWKSSTPEPAITGAPRIGDFRLWVGNTLMRAGEALSRLAKRMEP
jgi:hypothetical protein